MPSAAYRAAASSRAESTSRWRTSSTDSCDATARTASLTAFSAGLSGSDIALDDSFRVMPRYWFWLQVLIIVFVLAGMVIAITKLA